MSDKFSLVVGCVLRTVSSASCFSMISAASAVTLVIIMAVVAGPIIPAFVAS